MKQAFAQVYFAQGRVTMADQSSLLSANRLIDKTYSVILHPHAPRCEILILMPFIGMLVGMYSCTIC